jgi:hypothetical protein
MGTKQTQELNTSFNCRLKCIKCEYRLINIGVIFEEDTRLLQIQRFNIHSIIQGLGIV